MTVAIQRRVLPQNVPAVTRWVQVGVNLADRYPGFLGSRKDATSSRRRG
ncbi:hypothetical protein JN535_03900 [Cellulosimicrobium cellulans]|nr:hypothetical protein [Cellulosimicrobium cellulans]MBN0039316.1 hypothetical protein [Cellulosimicrobium cellulans]